MDEYVWQDGNTLAVRDGKRSGAERRGGEERRGNIAKGIFANLTRNRRRSERRMKLENRRKVVQPSIYERIIEIAGSMSVGIFLILLGAISIITGLTFFPFAGVALGIIMVMAGFVFIFVPS